MNRQIAMVLAGVVTTLAVVGGTVAAAQSGVLSTSTTSIQANGEINVPKTVPQPTVVEPTAAATIVPTTPTTPTETPDVEIITTTEVIPIQYITKTVVIEKRDTSVEAALMIKLNQAYQVIKDRDAAYQAKLQDAYNKLAAAQAAVQQPAPQQESNQAAAPQATNPQSQPNVQPQSNPPPKSDPPPATKPPTADPPPQPTAQHHEDHPDTEIQKPEDPKKP